MVPLAGNVTMISDQRLLFNDGAVPPVPLSPLLEQFTTTRTVADDEVPAVVGYRQLESISTPGQD